MPLLEDAKKIAEKVTGWSRPSDKDLTRVIRERKPTRFPFKDDGLIPNDPRWPLIVFRGAVSFAKKLDPAAVSSPFGKYDECHDLRGTPPRAEIDS